MRDKNRLSFDYIIRTVVSECSHSNKQIRSLSLGCKLEFNKSLTG